MGDGDPALPFGSKQGTRQCFIIGAPGSEAKFFFTLSAYVVIAVRNAFIAFFELGPAVLAR